MKKITSLLFIIWSVLGVNAQKDVSNVGEVTPIKSNVDFDGTQIMYALPKNIVRIEFTVEKKQFVRGPYAKYAAKYLNITEGVIGADAMYYSISDINFQRYAVVDSSKFFSIGKINPFNIPEIRLNADGVIISYNSDSEIEGYEAKSCPEIFKEKEFEDELFLDMGLHPFLFEKSETLYRTVKTDSNEMQVPYTQKKMVSTSDEQNAEEAAAFIRKLRKRRAKLLFGMKDEVSEFDGVAIKTMIHELKQLEKSYLELFVGRKQFVEHKYYFDFEPEADVVQEQAILCYFSSKKGISSNKNDARRGDYEPIILKSNLLGSIPKPKLKLMDNSGKTPTSINYGLYYRIPGRVKLTLKTKNAVLAQQQIQIAQKGSVVPLPGEYLVDRKFAVDFYPETGGLKSIKHNKE